MATKSPDQGWREWVLGSLPIQNTMTEQATGGFQPPTAADGPLNFGGLRSAPQFDLLEVLPPAAADRLRLLRQRSADAHALIPEFESIREASMARVEAENALKRLTNHPHDGGFGLKSDDRQVIAAQRTLDKATDDFERIKQRSEDRTAAWHAASGALANVETWLTVGRPSGVLLQDHETEAPKLAKNEAGLLDAVENRRRRVRELRADLHRIASAPFPSSYAKQRMREQIDVLAMQGAPSVSLLIEHDGKIELKTTSIRSNVLNATAGALAFTEMSDAVALVAWLHKDALIAALDREIASEADDKAALSHEAREKAEAEVQGDLLAIERDECALVWQAQAQSLPVQHRGDCSPLAILQVRLITQRAGPPPETSPEHAYNIVGGRRR